MAVQGDVVDYWSQKLMENQKPEFTLAVSTQLRCDGSLRCELIGRAKITSLNLIEERWDPSYLNCLERGDKVVLKEKLSKQKTPTCS